MSRRNQKIREAQRRSKSVKRTLAPTGSNIEGDQLVDAPITTTEEDKATEKSFFLWTAIITIAVVAILYMIFML